MVLKDYIELFSEYLQGNLIKKEPKNLYQPMQYILQLGGKRIRPVLTLIAAEGFGIPAKKALSAALAVEVFHNFTLLHDDIMDQAPIRRGKPTVHHKWNVNTGILSGDVMMINAYKYLNDYETKTFVKLTKLLTQTAEEVCVGQQYDMDFETRNDVSLPEYMKMIELKTAVLLGAALKMGAIVANSSEMEQYKIYQFGVQIGLAFQLQDDFLDTFGNAETFGKQIGGDIMENKKTWLYLKTLALANVKDKADLYNLYTVNQDDTNKIEKVKSLFVKYETDKLIQKEMEDYLLKAQSVLNELDFKEDQKNILKTLIEQLKNREN